MGRHKIHLQHTGLGIQANSIAYFTDRLHQEGSQAVHPQTTEKSKPTIPKRPYQVWNQKAIFHATIIGTTFLQDRK